MTNLKIALVIFTLTAINFSFQVDFVVFMPLGPTLMKKFLLSPGEFSLLVSVYTLAAGVTSIIFSLITTSSFAYLGPGMGGGVIAATLGIVVAIFAALFGLIWFPVKRLLKKQKERKQQKQNKID